MRAGGCGVIFHPHTSQPLYAWPFCIPALVRSHSLCLYLFLFYRFYLPPVEAESPSQARQPVNLERAGEEGLVLVGSKVLSACPQAPLFGS